MEIHQLRYFCAVARHGSFTRAAEQEGVAQPSLSQQIARLETGIGCRLFDRLGRTVQLTEAGRALLPQAQQILRDVQGARHSVEALRNDVGGRLSIGCIPTITPYFLAPKLGDFAERYPGVDLRIAEDITPKLVDLLRAGDLDVAIVSPPVHNPDVVCSDLFREPIFAAVGPRHRLASAETVSLPDLQQERLLLLKEGHCFRDNALTVCSRARTHFISTFETNQFSSIFPLVQAGFGVSLVPQMAAPAAHGCKLLKLERESFRRIGYMRVRQHGLGTAQKEFIRWLRTVSREREAESVQAAAG